MSLDQRDTKESALKPHRTLKATSMPELVPRPQRMKTEMAASTQFPNTTTRPGMRSEIHPIKMLEGTETAFMMATRDVPSGRLAPTVAANAAVSYVSLFGLTGDPQGGVKVAQAGEEERGHAEPERRGLEHAPVKVGAREGVRRAPGGEGHAALDEHERNGVHEEEREAERHHRRAVPEAAEEAAHDEREDGAADARAGEEDARREPAPLDKPLVHQRRAGEVQRPREGVEAPDGRDEVAGPGDEARGDDGRRGDEQAHGLDQLPLARERGEEAGVSAALDQLTGPAAPCS